MFGILIVEDLFAILLLVLLSTVAIKNRVSGADLATSSLRLLGFVMVSFVVGVLLLPPLFYRLRAKLNDETLLIFSLGLCFMMVVLITNAGFSPALGAFLMGSILAESREANRIEKLLHPLKDLFGAVFFVSVGMMIDPAAIREHIGLIALLTCLTIAGKFATTLAGALLSGRGLRHSVQTGLSLTQIGEFSFIIANLGLTLKVTSDFLYPIAVGVSALTTFTTPFLIRIADSTYTCAVRILPAKLLATLEAYSARTQRIPRGSGNMNMLGSLKMVLRQAFFSVKSKTMPALAPWNAHISTIVVSPEAEGAGRTLGELQVRERYGVTVAWISRGRRMIAAPGRGERILPGDIVGFLGTDEQIETFGTAFEAQEQIFPSDEINTYRLYSMQLSGDMPFGGCTIRESGIRERINGLVVGVERGKDRFLKPDSSFLLLPGDLLWIVGNSMQTSSL